VFANVGWGEMLLLVVVGLVVLGPERLPGAIAWTAGTMRQARDYLSGATRELREELGPEFEGLREPLNEIQKLRGMTPRAAITKHLLDGDDSWLTGEFDRTAGGQERSDRGIGTGGQERSDRGIGTAGGQERSDRGIGTVKPQSTPTPPQSSAGPAPFDSDAT